MKKMKSIKYAALLYTGLMLWTPPCYSFFPWPTFDVAEVAATIKGYVTSTQSMISTVQSTAIEFKKLSSIGDGKSSVKLFFNPEELKKIKDAKLARIKANKERLDALREKLADEVATVIPGDNSNSENATNTDVANADEYENTEENFDDFNVDDSLTETEESFNGILIDTAGNKRGFLSRGDANNPTDDMTSNVEDNANAPTDDTTSNAGNNANAPAGGFLSRGNANAPAGGFLSRGDANAPAGGFLEGVKDNANGTLVSVGTIGDIVPNETEQEETTQGIKEVIPSVGKAIEVNLPKKPKIKLPTTSRGFRKTSSNTYINGFEVSYAQLGGVYTGTNEEGRYVFPDIIAQKCEMNYDEVDENAIKNCIKTWVECLNGGGEEGSSVMDGLACTKLFKRAKHEEATGDLTAAINDKEYANSFEADVADDLENKSGSLSSEREDLSFLGEVGKANQKILIRMLHSMSSKLIQEGIAAIEFVEPGYYEGE